MHCGTIVRVNVAGGFFFISPDFPSVTGGRDVFGHASKLHEDIKCDELLKGRRVRFTFELAPKGPKATKVLGAD